MLRKLGGYTVIFVCSFCFFTFLFHTIVGAEAQSGVQLRPTPIPVPTLVPTTKLRRNPTPTRILTTPSQTTTSPTPTPPPAGGPQVLALALPITTATPTLIVTPTVTPKPTVQPTATVVQPTPTAVPATPTPTPPAGGPTFPPTTDIDTLFSRYSDMYHADKSTLQKIARCESGFNSQAVNGPYLGMFQFASQTWISNRTRMGLDTNPDLRTSAEEAIKTAAFMIGNGGVNAWAGCL